MPSCADDSEKMLHEMSRKYWREWGKTYDVIKIIHMKHSDSFWLAHPGEQWIQFFLPLSLWPQELITLVKCSAQGENYITVTGRKMLGIYWSDSITINYTNLDNFFFKDYCCEITTHLRQHKQTDDQRKTQQHKLQDLLTLMFCKHLMSAFCATISSKPKYNHVYCTAAQSL